MDYKKFKREVKERIGDYLPPDCQATYHTRNKVNRKLDALCLEPVKEEEKYGRALPVFYIQDLYDWYQAGNSLDHILRYIVSFVGAAPPKEIMDQNGFSPEQLKESLVFQLIHYGKNYDLLETVPHRKFLDLAVIYRSVVIDQETGSASAMTITNEIMDDLHMTEEDLYETARSHMPEVFPFVCKDAGSLIGKSSGEGEEKRMCVLTTEQFQFGACAMLYPEILELAAEEFGGSYAILPGSIHELYLIKYIPEHEDVWKSVVESANKNLVNPSEWLSDNIYFYDSSDKTVKVLL